MENSPFGVGTSFWKGAIGGFVLFGGFILPAQIGAAFWLALIIKVLASSAIAGASGLATLLMTDFYNYKMKHRIRNILKSKRNGKDKDNNRAA